MSRSRPLLFCVILAVAVTACSKANDRAQTQDQGGEGAATPQIFDSSVVHKIDLRFDVDDYEKMIATFADAGEKTWIEATVVIDAVTYKRAGLRLKGNSSLGGLGGGIGRRPQQGAAPAPTTAAGDPSRRRPPRRRATGNGRPAAPAGSVLRRPTAPRTYHG